MARPIATTGQPGAPIATGGHPQKPSKPVRTIQVKAHTRRVAPSPLKQAGLSRGQIAYWQNKLPGASAKTILRARARQQFNHNPQAFGPNTDLSPIQANQQSQAAANLKYGATLTADQNQVNNLPGWFQAYQNSVAQLQQQAAANAQAAVTGINTSGQQVGQMQQQLQQSALQAMGQDAASRGAQVDPNLAASASQFQAGLAALNASDASRAQAVGNSENAYLANLGAIQQAAGQQAQTRAQQQLNLDRQARADYQTTQRQNLIDAAQKQGDVLSTLNLNNTKANQTFKTNQAKLKVAQQVANQTGRNQRSGIRVRQQSNAIRQQEAANNASVKRDSQNMKRADFIAKYGITPEQANKGIKPIRGVKGTGAGGLTPTQVRSFNQKVDKSIAIMNSDPKKPSAKNPGSVQQWANYLTAHQGVPHSLALAIVDQFVYGGVDQKTASHLRQVFGVHLKVGPKPGAGALAEPNT